MLVNGTELRLAQEEINYFIRSDDPHTKPKERNKELIPDQMPILTAIATAVYI